MYYNSPNIRFSDKSLDEFYNSTDFYLCKQEIGERFVFEIIENEVSTLCTNFGLVTGPEVIVEVPKLIETIATSTISSNENNASNQKASENYTTTSSSEDTNQASVDPLIIAILTVVLLIFISVTNFFLIRRKWFKESRATTLTLDAFESHWQYIIPPSESNNNINE
uniref:Uncharacterized protein n=1 Tax=Panagrolaimus sp. ES5 TaxID=591445 RepID=A0AC34G0X0_9BILA